MSIKLPWDDYTEDAIACPVCHKRPTEYVGHKPMFMCGIHCGDVYGSMLQCDCGNESCSSNDLREIYYDWNLRVIPMIKQGNGNIRWPSDYMTLNARRIYEKMVEARPDIINQDYLVQGDCADYTFCMSTALKDIANHLDSLGVVIPE